MSNNVRFSRVIVNIIIFNLYWLLASIVFSFVFPLTLMWFWLPVLDSRDPIFAKIQIAIIVLVLVFSIVFRKYFYFSIKNWNLIDTYKNSKKELELEHDMKALKEEKQEKIEQFIETEKKDKLDIKIGREIK